MLTASGFSPEVGRFASKREERALLRLLKEPRLVGEVPQLNREGFDRVGVAPLRLHDYRVRDLQDAEPAK